MGVVADLGVEGIELGAADRAGLVVNLVIGQFLPFREHGSLSLVSADIAAER
jgi:hypothetical protein